MGKKKKKNNNTNSKTCLRETLSQFLKEYEENPDTLLQGVTRKDLSRKNLLEDFDASVQAMNNQIYDNEDLQIILFCNKEIREVLLKLSDQGADIVKIYNCIRRSQVYEHELNPSALPLLPHAELHPGFNTMIDDSVQGQKEFRKKVRALRGAVKLICGLKPIRMNAIDELRINHPDFNEKLADVQRELDEVANLYIEYTPFFSNKAGNLSGYIGSDWARPISKIAIPQKITSKSHLWNARIVTIVDELKRIGFSGREAYTRTAELFNLSFPEIWIDDDPDLIRQRYTYHKKPKNNKSSAI